jgi:hypothetical protein
MNQLFEHSYYDDEIQKPDLSHDSPTHPGMVYDIVSDDDATIMMEES